MNDNTTIILISTMLFGLPLILFFMYDMYKIYLDHKYPNVKYTKFQEEMKKREDQAP